MPISAAKYRLVSIISTFAFGILIFTPQLHADTIPVRHLEGITHGFVVLRDSTGRAIAYGDMTQQESHGQLTSRLAFHFEDGSVYDDTTIYSEHRVFRVLSDHLIEKGPSFKQPIETWVDTKTSEFKAQSFGKGKDKTISQKLKLPRDLSNGILYVVAKNIDPKAPSTTVSMVVGTPKARVVKMIFTPEGEGEFLIGRVKRQAIHYVIKVDLGGAAGVVAPLVGKQPSNTDLWISAGDFPTFLKMQGALYDSGPIWTIELTLPRWPAKSSSGAQRDSSH